MKSSLTTFRRNRKKLKEIGVKGLIPAGIILAKASSYVDKSIYNAFKEYLSENTDKTLKQNYLEFKSSFLQNNTSVHEWQFPSYAAITIKIKKDFSDKDTKTKFDTFKEVAVHYMEVISLEKRLKSSTIKEHEGHLRQHLIPFFNHMKLTDFNLKTIEEYKKFVINSAKISKNGLRKQLILIKSILKTYSSNKINIVTSKILLAKDFTSCASRVKLTMRSYNELDLGIAYVFTKKRTRNEDCT